MQEAVKELKVDRAQVLKNDTKLTEPFLLRNAGKVTWPSQAQIWKLAAINQIIDGTGLARPGGSF